MKYKYTIYDKNGDDVGYIIKEELKEDENHGREIYSESNEQEQRIAPREIRSKRRQADSC